MTSAQSKRMQEEPLSTDSPTRRRPLSLKVDSDDEDEDALAKFSFRAGDHVFMREGIAITKEGVNIDSTADSKSPQPIRKRIADIREADLQLIEVIGRGSSGLVQKMHHLPTKSLIAVKVINIYEKSMRDQVLREIRTLHNASCPNVVQFLGAFLSGISVNVCLEYCDMGSLDRVQAKFGPIIPEEVLAAIAFQILTGLNYLKIDGHVHRDIKPQNILLTRSGLVKISDFGIARQLEGESAMANTFVGTFQYMSPERLRNEEYDFSSDIWSFGLVLYEGATGRSPFTDSEIKIEFIQTVVEGDPPKLPPGDFSLEFEEFLSSCLQKDPLRRPTTEDLIYSGWLDARNATRAIIPCNVVLDDTTATPLSSGHDFAMLGFNSSDQSDYNLVAGSHQLQESG